MTVYRVIRRVTATARDIDRKAARAKAIIFGSTLIPHVYHTAYHRIHSATYATYFGSLAMGAHDFYVGAALVLLVLTILGMFFGES
jgi:hypothetical protein